MQPLGMQDILYKKLISLFLGCYDDNGKDIEADQDFLDKNNLKYHCYRFLGP
jgi:hypothetical protein